MLAELIGALKKMSTLAGGVLIVEPSTGSEPMTKACASAAGGRDSKGDQVNASSKLRLSAETSRGLRKRPCRIKSPHGSGFHSFEIVHQPAHARNICPVKFCRGEGGEERLPHIIRPRPYGSAGLLPFSSRCSIACLATLLQSVSGLARKIEPVFLQRWPRPKDLTTHSTMTPEVVYLATWDSTATLLIP